MCNRAQLTQTNWVMFKSCKSLAETSKLLPQLLAKLLFKYIYLRCPIMLESFEEPNELQHCTTTTIYVVVVRTALDKVRSFN